jgi:hypothetical protein
MRRVALTILTVLGLMLAPILAAPVSAGSSGVTLATGSFTLVRDQGSHRTFSFVVDERPGGEITGEAQWILFGGAVVHIDVNCFTRVGNQAIVGGTSTDLGGITAAFAIQDDPDIIGLVLYSDDVDFVVNCDNMLEVSGEPDITGELNDFGVQINQGNVMIRQAN